MELYLLLHSAVMHVTAALVILVYIPLSVPVKLLVRAFVKPLRKEDLRGKVVLITGASSGIGEVSTTYNNIYLSIDDYPIYICMHKHDICPPREILPFACWIDYQMKLISKSSLLNYCWLEHYFDVLANFVLLAGFWMSKG